MNISNKNKISGWFTEPKIPLGVFILFLLFGIGMSWGASNLGKEDLQSNIQKHYLIGDSISSSILSFTVEDVRKDILGAGPLTPREGYLFIIPTISITNKKMEPYDFSPFLAMHIKDGRGNVYNVEAVPTKGNQLAGLIAPGDSLREEIGFEVAKDATNLTLYFDLSAPSRQVIAVSLEKKSTWWSRLIS